MLNITHNLNIYCIEVHSIEFFFLIVSVFIIKHFIVYPPFFSGTQIGHPNYPNVFIN